MIGRASGFGRRPPACRNIIMALRECQAWRGANYNEIATIMAHQQARRYLRPQIAPGRAVVDRRAVVARRRKCSKQGRRRERQDRSRSSLEVAITYTGSGHFESWTDLCG